jgi:hypothetical protein
MTLPFAELPERSTSAKRATDREPVQPGARHRAPSKALAKVLQFQNRPATESAGKNGYDGTCEIKHADDTTAAYPKL